MKSNFVTRREQVMDRANRALDKAWPARKSAEFVRESESVVSDLVEIAAAMKASNADAVEQSRTHRLLGSVYSDLEPALGKKMLFKARDAYRKAEKLLEGHDDDLERARLDFNLGNTLRQTDPNDIEQLQEAERRFLAARKVFAGQAPEYLAQVDEALLSTRKLLGIAPLAITVERGRSDLGQDHGVPGDPQVAAVFQLLEEKLRSEVEAGKVAPERAKTLESMLEVFRKPLTSGKDDLQSLMTQTEEMRAQIAAQFANMHYLSHGIERPPEGSRAADLVELLWAVRLFLLEQSNLSGKSEGESKVLFDLTIRSTKLDKRIYEAGGDNARAKVVEKEAFRPLALEVRSFAARNHPMLARPIWPGTRVPVDTESVFFSGSGKVRNKVAKVCRRLALKLINPPKGESIATARWKQLQKASTTILDLTVKEGPGQAAVAYELGIAQTLGKPVVVLFREGQKIPFNIDIEPVLLSGTAEDSAALSDAINYSLVGAMPPGRSEAVRATIDNVLAQYPVPHDDVYVNQTLKQLQRQLSEADPVAVTTTLKTLTGFLNDHARSARSSSAQAVMFIQPAWPPAYPESGTARLFHVMPFRPDWANDAVKSVGRACDSAGVQYVRGDQVEELNIIRSIWEEINRATHVLVDLTGFNPNVALELGIAHTLGRRTLMVGQGDTKDRLFPMIARLRLYPYQSAKGTELGDLVKTLLSRSR